MSAEKRDRILESALKVFSEKGFYTASMDDIARESKISKGGIYFYFPSKDDIFCTLIREMGESLIRRLKLLIDKYDSPQGKLEALLDGIVDLFVKYQGLARFLLIESFASNPVFERERQNVIQGLETLVSEVIRLGKEEGSFNSDIDEELVASLWVGAVHHVIIDGLIKGDLQRVKEKKEGIKKYLLKGGIFNEKAD